MFSSVGGHKETVHDDRLVVRSKGDVHVGGGGGVGLGHR